MPPVPEFIRAWFADVSQMLGELQAKNKRMEGLLREYAYRFEDDWNDKENDGYTVCRYCGETWGNHTPSCLVSRTHKELGTEK